MTRYEQGFLTKCASAGVPEQIAVALLKRAQHVSFQKHPDTRQDMVVTTQPDGTSTTNSPTGVSFMPGTYYGSNVDVDPVNAAHSAALDQEINDGEYAQLLPQLTDESKGKLVTAVGGLPKLTPEGTNIVDRVYGPYPSPRGSLPKGVPASRRTPSTQWTMDVPSKKQPSLIARLFGAEKLWDKIPNYDRWAELLKARK